LEGGKSLTESFKKFLEALGYNNPERIKIQYFDLHHGLTNPNQPGEEVVYLGIQLTMARVTWDNVKKEGRHQLDLQEPHVRNMIEKGPIGDYEAVPGGIIERIQFEDFEEGGRIVTIYRAPYQKKGTIPHQQSQAVN
jgi:hypothetical protein